MRIPFVAGVLDWLQHPWAREETCLPAGISRLPEAYARMSRTAWVSGFLREADYFKSPFIPNWNIIEISKLSLLKSLVYMLMFWHFMGFISTWKRSKVLDNSVISQWNQWWCKIFPLSSVLIGRKTSLRNELPSKSLPLTNSGWTLQPTKDVLLWWSFLTTGLRSFVRQLLSAWMEKGMGSGDNRKTPTLILPSFSQAFLPCLKKDEQFLFGTRISPGRCSNGGGPEGRAVQLYRSYLMTLCMGHVTEAPQSQF